MAGGKIDDSSTQHHLLPQDNQPQQQNYIILPIYLPAINSCQCRRIIFSAAAFLFLATAGFVMWPSEPDPSVVRLRLRRFHIHTSPRLSVDITLDLTVNIRNPGFYSLAYTSMAASIAYRGKQLGFVTSDQGHIRARGSSYVNAMLELDDIEVLSDTIMMIEDLARGYIPFDTVTVVEGRLGLLFFDLPIKAKLSCEVDVNTHDQTIARQNCYTNDGKR